MSEDLSPQERASLLLGRLGEHAPPPPPPSPVETVVGYDADLIPEIDSPKRERTELDDKLDAAIGQIDIVTAYTRWCGKMTPVVGRRTESVMVSCPNPNHPDTNPSAWLNVQKDVYFCGACQQGGDKYDIAAYHFGYPVPEYKKNGDFPRLRSDMGQDLGVQIVRGITGEEYVVSEEEPEAPAPSAPPPPPAPIPLPVPAVDTVAPQNAPATHAPPPPPEPVATVTQLPGTEPEEPDEPIITEQERHSLKIEWDQIAPTNTFLREWMNACTIDDLPHEYYFWLGLQALAFCAGSNVTMDDFRPVKSNLNVCIYGGSGTGKSRSLGPYKELLRKALPFQGDADHMNPPTGVSLVATPGSAEALLDEFKWDIVDGSMTVIDQAPVMGLLTIEEFASFISKASRSGSSLKEILIELYDVHNETLAHRTRSGGTMRIKNPYCQVVTTTQPKAIHAFLRQTDTESGFLNRWIIAAGQPRIAPIPHGGVQIDVDRAVSYLQEVNAWAETADTMILAGDALEVWTQFFNRNLAGFKAGLIEMDSMLARIDLMLKKIIILLTVNSKLPHPTPETVEAACKLYPYLVSSYQVFSRDIGFTENIECQNRILEICQQRAEQGEKPPTRRDIVRLCRGKFDLEIVDKTLKVMVSMQVIHEEVAKGRGRPTTRYSLGA